MRLIVAKLLILDKFCQAIPLGLGRDHGILGGLGQPELHGGLGLDFNRLAGMGIPANPSCPFRLHQLAESRDRELALFPGLGGC